MTGAKTTSSAVETAREYYDSSDADNFYAMIWGGEDIHVGIYEAPDEPVFDASRRTVETIIKRISRIDASTRVLDIGSGYGGAARYLAETYGCTVVALNLSNVENERARALNAEGKLDHLIDVVDGSFEEIPRPNDSFDLVWSQDAILHSGDRERVLSEVARVLKWGGEFLFTDPMQADDCPTGVLQPILDRIHLESLGSPGFYRQCARRLGLSEVGFTPLTEQLVTHYTRILEETARDEAKLAEHVDPDYVSRMKTGLRHWIEGGRLGYLVWGIFQFSKAMP